MSVLLIIFRIKPILAAVLPVATVTLQEMEPKGEAASRQFATRQAGSQGIKPGAIAGVVAGVLGLTIVFTILIVRRRRKQHVSPVMTSNKYLLPTTIQPAIAPPPYRPTPITYGRPHRSAYTHTPIRAVQPLPPVYAAANRPGTRYYKQRDGRFDDNNDKALMGIRFWRW
ncbi:hypothetical protein L204_105846 [Cryptococcus depauperatus]